MSGQSNHTSITAEQFETLRENFYDGEEQMAQILLQTAVECRQNHINALPFIFIQTHKDTCDKHIQKLAKNWLNKVHNILNEEYVEQGSYAKTKLVKTILSRSNFIKIDSTASGEVFDVLKRIGEIQDAVSPAIVGNGWLKWLKSVGTYIKNVNPDVLKGTSKQKY